jgi:hypothetical protein
MKKKQPSLFQRIKTIVTNSFIWIIIAFSLVIIHGIGLGISHIIPHPVGVGVLCGFGIGFIFFKIIKV